MQLLIFDLDAWHETISGGPQDGETAHCRMLRHWLVYPDGRLFYQDEVVRRLPSNVVESTRGEWIQLPTPPTIPMVAGVAEYQGLPVAITGEGKAYVWAVTPARDAAEERAYELARMSHQIHMLPHAWIQFHEPIPGTPAHSLYEG